MIPARLIRSLAPVIAASALVIIALAVGAQPQRFAVLLDIKGPIGPATRSRHRGCIYWPQKGMSDLHWFTLPERWSVIGMKPQFFSHAPLYTFLMRSISVRKFFMSSLRSVIWWRSATRRDDGDRLLGIDG